MTNDPNTLRVDGNANLVKDFQSGAVINTDQTGYRAARAAKKKRAEFALMKSQIEDILRRLAALEEKL